MTNRDFWDSPDLLILTGSILYGCSGPNSDRDERGFVVEPPEYLLGRERFDQRQWEEPTDKTVWGLMKFLKLLESGSPNTLEMLFAPDSCIITKTEVGQKLLDNRNLFLTKQITKPFFGFAEGEWRKVIAPTSKDFGAKRKGHVAHFGYSIKNAYHCIRLLEELIEIFEHNTITFPRPNADFLRSIKDGNASLDEVSLLYNSLLKKAEGLAEKSTMRTRIDRRAVDELYYEIIAPEVTKFFNDKFSGKMGPKVYRTSPSRL